jgi:hypothetical protein
MGLGWIVLIRPPVFIIILVADLLVKVEIGIQVTFLSPGQDKTYLFYTKLF